MLIIRKETEKDHGAIESITIKAFTDHPFSKQTEHLIIRELRKHNVLTLSLVAELDSDIIGHLAFSPVTISDGTTNWIGLGPISVHPNMQKQGIGSKLMVAGLEIIKEMGYEGCALVGDPRYYKRFGFDNNPQLEHVGIPPENFLVLPFSDDIAQGIVTFHDSFLIGLD